MLDVNILKSALLFRIKGDVRYFVNAIYIRTNVIVATDGHTLFLYERENLLKEVSDSTDEILIPNSLKIPSNARYFYIKIIEDNQFSMCFFDKNRVYLSSYIDSLIFGPYPNYERVFPDKNNKKSKPNYHFNLDYIKRITDVLNLLKIQKDVKLVQYSANEAAICESSTEDVKVSFIVMPLR